ncbi:hypothetical protein [Erythrobacter sp. SG61-1L]|uniref:hypothetical protein n=1 Tax=Erythrobacter sp. SG61-1L TaxID=1603897 RepID=UPI0012E12C25|nr:hypothetical protein [Erythrobacter sp. SG61-1L]
MRMILQLAAGSALAAQGVAPAFAETVNATINVGTNERNGVCYIYLPRDDGMELEISVRAEDTNVNLKVANIPSEWVDEGEGQDVPISIKPNKGKAFTSDHGEYVAGITYRIQGWNDESGKGSELLSALKGGKTFTVEFGGRKAGAFEIQQASGDMFKDYAYNFMKRCIGNNGGATDF